MNISSPVVVASWPSIDDVRPSEEGGPNARIGFNYQDEVAVSFLIEMLDDPEILKVHLETHDDLVVVRRIDSTTTAEFIQVKAAELDKLWSVADLCRRENGPSTSIFEASLNRDGCAENSRFRIVTLRPVVDELKLLTFPRGASGREPCNGRFLSLSNEIWKRFPDIRSPKRNGASYWLKHCLWDVQEAQTRLLDQLESLRSERTTVLSKARDETVPPERSFHIEQRGQQRAQLLVELEKLQRRQGDLSERRSDIARYRTDLVEESERMGRAQDASEVLADLRITHCPACDQTVNDNFAVEHQCFLCHQLLPDEASVKGLGAARLRFEQERLLGELKEADELAAVLERDARGTAEQIRESQELLRMVENELAPARTAVAALAQDSVSAIDVAIGELNERQRQIGRLGTALALGRALTKQVVDVEKEIVPIQARVEESLRAIDFDEAESLLSDGMNEYLQAINRLKPNAWPHNRVTVDVSRSAFRIKVGARRWDKALGGTDTLYFLMAYQYGLLALSDKKECNYPGFAIIDVPGEFSGEAVEDKENFIVQPFIDLLAKKSFNGAQAIITGAAFTGLQGVSTTHLTELFVA